MLNFEMYLGHESSLLIYGKNKIYLNTNIGNSKF